MDRLKKKSAAELKKLNKDELVSALSELINAKETNVSNASILEEIRAMRRDFEEHAASVNKTVKELSVLCKKLNGEVDILKRTVELQEENFLNQQIAIEQLFARERASNIIINGLKEDPEVSDSKLIELMSEIVECDIAVTDFKRIGTSETRPILITCENAGQRKKMLENGNKLKSAGERDYNGVNIDWKNVFIRKDVHPAIRKEWGRLRKVVRTEKEKPENDGIVIVLDNHSRKVLRDGVIIDCWKTNFITRQ